MDIITLFNYPEGPYGTLLQVWVFQCLKVFLYDESSFFRSIRIFSPTPPPLPEFLAGGRVQWEKIEVAERRNNDFSYNTRGLKLQLLCSQKKSPFVFLDVDAILVDPKTFAQTLPKIFFDKPFMAVNHQRIPGHTAHLPYAFLNSGVLFVSNPSFLPPYKELLAALDPSTLLGAPPGDQGDQTLLWNLCLQKDYDYTHPSLHVGWNTCGGILPREATTRTSYVPLEEFSVFPVVILHYWWRFKPFLISCPVYQALCKELSENQRWLERLLLPLGGLIIVNASATDGSDRWDPVLPIGVGWKFSFLSSSPFPLPPSHRPLLMYVNFDVTTDIRRRGPVRKIFHKTLCEVLKHKAFPPTLPFEEYWKGLERSFFVASPEGNGIDCHRHHEAWMAGCVPVIEENEGMREKYKGLPILWTKDYSECTHEYLESQKAEFLSKPFFDYSRLRKDFYSPSQIQELERRSHFWMSRLK